MLVNRIRLLKQEKPFCEKKFKAHVSQQKKITQPPILEKYTHKPTFFRQIFFVKNQEDRHQRNMLKFTFFIQKPCLIDTKGRLMPRIYYAMKSQII